jgi:hypothetical protein
MSNGIYFHVLQALIEGIGMEKAMEFLEVAHNPEGHGP